MVLIVMELNYILILSYRKIFVKDGVRMQKGGAKMGRKKKGIFRGLRWYDALRLYIFCF